jgi:hypothetical protein
VCSTTRVRVGTCINKWILIVLTIWWSVVVSVQTKEVIIEGGGEVWLQGSMDVVTQRLLVSNICW